MNTYIDCPDCDAVCGIKHNMDEDVYKITFCPCCGYEVEDDEMEFGDYEDEND